MESYRTHLSKELEQKKPSQGMQQLKWATICKKLPGLDLSEILPPAEPQLPHQRESQAMLV